MAWLSNYRILWAIIFVLIGLNLASMSVLWITRQRKPLFHLPPRHAGPGDHFLKRALELSNEQAEQFDRLESAHRQHIDQLTDEIHQLRQSLMSRMAQQVINTDTEDLIQQINKKQAELELKNFHHFKEVNEMLNDEQRARFADIMHRAFMPERGRMHPGDIRHDLRRGPGAGKPQ